MELTQGTADIRFARRGALAFGLTLLAGFALSAWYAARSGEPQAGYFWMVMPLCGFAGGLAYGRRLGLAIVFAITFLFAGSMFMLQEDRSTAFVNVVWMGCASGFVFWIIGECATLTLPTELRGAGAKSFAVPGALAGIVFQFLYGPGYSLLDLGQRAWWGRYSLDHLALWLIAAAGGGWLFGASLDDFNRLRQSKPQLRERNRWGATSVALGVAGIAISAVYIVRYEIPLDSATGLSPATAVSDWLTSWALLAGATAVVALFQTMLRRLSQAPTKYGWGWAGVGLVLAGGLMFMATRIAANPWKAQFNKAYGEKLLSQSTADDPAHQSVVYRGNLILAQAALDNNDVTAASEHLIAAAGTNGFQSLTQTGPDTSVARVLLQRGQKQTVAQYLSRFHKLWPAGEVVLNRWETALRAGRQPNFNNRSTEPPPQVTRVEAR